MAAIAKPKVWSLRELSKSELSFLAAKAAGFELQEEDSVYFISKRIHSKKRIKDSSGVSRVFYPGGLGRCWRIDPRTQHWVPSDVRWKSDSIPWNVDSTW